MNQVGANPSTSLSPRQCAAELLSAVLDEKRPLDEALMRHAGLGRLSARDRAFARLMVMTVLRRRGQIDALLKQMLEKPLAGKSGDVMHCLRLGVAQLIWLKTPAHAAVHAMVETVAHMGHERMKGLVNAVLKRVDREGAGIIAAQDEASLNLPPWLYGSWRKAYGEDVARAIAQATLSEPPLDITVKDGAQVWAEKLGGTLLPTGSVRIAGAGRVEELAGYGEGAWWVQDMAAALPVKLLGDVNGKEALDLCAAPGGKTAQLLVAGARVTAVDKSTRRLALLKANLHRLKLEATLIEADILRFAPERQFDIVLLDAPCSATGTLRRHPEAVWHKSEEDVSELVSLQRRLLMRAAGWVKPGGKLLYCTCSLEPEEGEKQAGAFLAAHPGFRILAAPAMWQPLGFVRENGALRTHPGFIAGAGGMDGFYAICLHRLKDF